jgi:amidase
VEVVRAWVCVDDERLAAGGWTVGVKDIFDTADFPTECGSPIYKGHQPEVDAAAVSLLRAAGGVIAGKTVTAELAMFEPGPTTNPHRPTHTPGGSSSGSAAAVAAGMVDVALGTQTAGSVIRPASFCGVYGFKPTFGLVDRAGVKLVAPSLDTVGWFARDVANLDRVRVALTGQPPAKPLAGSPRVGVVRTEQWDDADRDSQAAVAAFAENAGAVDVPLPEVMMGLAADQPTVQAYEAARSLAWERQEHGAMLSAGLRDILDWGAAIGVDDYDRVRNRAAAARECWFDGVDVVVTPAVVGEAPEGLASTGDPRFARLWNLLGWPAVSIPGFSGATGLPVGVQLVAPPGHDEQLVAAAAWFAGR